ncbi:hypothetical protein ACHAWC_009613 [Mediolabrus comicus]
MTMTSATAMPAAQKFLSYSAILTLAANTMNGPGITTLPDVATDAGLLLYVILITGSVIMASFVCRRMVYAMWSSLLSSEKHRGTYQEIQQQQQEETASSLLLEGGNNNIAGGMKVSKSTLSITNDDNGDDSYHDDGYYDTTTTFLEQQQQQEELIHHRHSRSTETSDEVVQHHNIPNLSKSGSEEESLLLQLHNNNNINSSEYNNDDDEQNLPSSPSKTHIGYSQQQQQQPLLEKTSIVGQSLEAYGRKTSVYVAFTMVASALCLALAQMMLCAAILDGMLVSTMGQSCALGLPTTSSSMSTMSLSSWIHCTSHSSMKPYAGSGAPTSLISIGTIIAAVISVGMGTVDLDEMMDVQYSLFGCLIVSCIRFAYVLRHMSSELNNHDGGGVDVVVATDEGIVISNAEDLSWFVGPNPFSTIGPIMFNFAFVVTAPPLVAMAKKESIAYKALGMACVAMGVLYTLVGCVGAPVANAVRNGLVEGGDDTNLLSLILLSGKVGSGSTGRPSMIDLFCIGTFGLSTVASVPVYCLLAKDTLVNDAGVAPMPAFLLSNVLPWLLVALTYNAAFFEAFVNWSGLLILGYSNFSLPLPLLLDVKLKKVRSFLLRPSDQDSGITSAVFAFLTASITAVIAISITDSLSVASLSFGAVLMATMWPSEVISRYFLVIYCCCRDNSF